MTTIKEALQLMYDAGVRQIDIYFAELVNDGETNFSVDVMCDPINDMCESSWVWTVMSTKVFIRIIEEDKFFVPASWEIITDCPFSEDVVGEAVYEWVLANKLDVCVRVVDMDDAVGSGYIKRLREMNLEKEILNSTPLRTLHD